MSKKPVDPANARAMALSKKVQQQEGQEAVAEYKAQQKATREKTVRLQALRLARDAAPSKAKPAAADVSLHRCRCQNNPT
jgi:hypothetical protein